MKKIAFQVDTRLAKLLSENYRSTERALKELVDNAWDADAESVKISLPEPLSDDPIFVHDSGTGMTEEELLREYLFIASDRRKRRGELTAEKKRELFKKYGQSETDTGSPEGQVALFTQRINHLTEHLKKNRKDFSTERALVNMVGKRKRILNYLKDKDIERYRAIISELGIRK